MAREAREIRRSALAQRGVAPFDFETCRGGETADAADLKSATSQRCVGSSPSLGTKSSFVRKSQFKIDPGRSVTCPTVGQLWDYLTRAHFIRRVGTAPNAAKRRDSHATPVVGLWSSVGRGARLTRRPMARQRRTVGLSNMLVVGQLGQIEDGG